MKLNKKGWGYKVFIMCIAAIFFFGIIAYYYIVSLAGGIN